jgi:hypothetical protein
MATEDKQTLQLNHYVKPGTYIGQAYRPKVVNTGSFPRIPTMIGRGVPYLIVTNQEMIRAFVYRERLDFSSNAPFIASLQHPSNGSQLPSGTATVKLYNSKDEVIETKFWKFTKSSSNDSAPYDQIQIFSVDYNPNDTYYIDYQSTDRKVLDQLPIVGLRSVTKVGDRKYQDYYKQGVDFQMSTKIMGIDPDTDPTPATTNTGSGVVKVSSLANYSAWDRTYYLNVEDSKTVNVPTLGAISQSAGTGTGTLAFAASTNYTGNALVYTLTVANKVVVGSETTLDLTWSDTGNSGTITGISSSASSNIALTAGIRLNLSNLNQMQNGDVFTFAAVATPVTTVQVAWYSDDYQSNSGLLNLVSTKATTAIALESGLLLDFNNLTGFAIGDKWTVTCVNENAYDWNFTRSQNQSFTPSDVYYDSLGHVTDVPRSYYITLGHTPVGAVTLLNAAGVAISNAVPVEGTPYVRLATVPTTNFSASYSYYNSPDPGQTYYTTIAYTRPDSLYNTPLVYTSYADFLAEIGGPSAENHLGIMGDYGLNTIGLDLFAVIQIKDADHDGVYNVADYRTGLEASLRRKDLTDISVLGKFEILNDLIYNSQVANDPLYQALREYWIGYPIGYAIGSEEEPGTLAYTSAKVLQVSGANPAHGTFVSVANRMGKRTITQENGQSVQLTLDGSFVAAATACLNAKLMASNLNTLLVNQVLPGFDEIDTFDDVEIKLLGSSSNLYMTMPKGGMPKIVDAVTTDTTSNDMHEINVMMVKQYVTKRMIRDCDAALIGYVPRNVDDGIAYVRSTVRRVLVSLIGEGIIGDYTDDSGRPREIQTSDIDIWRSETDFTRYCFTYWFNGRYGIKRLTGLYSVDENAFKS